MSQTYPSFCQTCGALTPESEQNVDGDCGACEASAKPIGGCGCGATGIGPDDPGHHPTCAVYNYDPMSDEETEAMLALPQFDVLRAERSTKGHLLWLRTNGDRS